MRLILTILSLLWLNAQATVYYVKASGGFGSGLNDANAWNFATYKFNEPSLNIGDTVLFNRGDQFYGTLVPPSNVVINSYGLGAQPIVTGFTSLTTWTNVGTNLWEASVNAGAKLNMVTVNGVVTEPGRFPNSGWLTIVSGGTNSLTANANYSTYASGGVNPDIVIKKREWIIERDSVTSISGTTINFVNTTGFPALTNWGFFLTDHPATLDVQNEWYYKPGTLRMYSTVNPATLNVKAATLPNVLYMTGGISNVSFNTISFQGSNEHALFISGGSGNSLNNCQVKYAGKNGISAEFQSNFNIQNSEVTNTNWSGVDALFGNYQYITNNTVNNNGMLTSLCQPNNKANHGIWVNGTYNAIRYNTVSYTGYVGIDMSGDYDTTQFNYVHHFDQTSADGGGIYMSDEPDGVGRLIDQNVVVFGLGPRDGTPYSGFDNAMGIYLDEATGGVTISNNFSGFNAGGGLYLHRAHNITLTNNTFYGNTLQQALLGEDGIGSQRITNVDMSNNVFYSLSSSDLIFRIYCQDNTSNFFSRSYGNKLVRPAGSTDIIHEIINYFSGGQYYYNLSQWQGQYPNLEVLSTGTPPAFATGSPTIQTSFGSKSFVPLDGEYTDINGVVYKAGTVVLQPFSGAVLMRTGDFVPVVTQKKIIKGFRFK